MHRQSTLITIIGNGFRSMPDHPCRPYKSLIADRSTPESVHPQSLAYRFRQKQTKPRTNFPYIERPLARSSWYVVLSPFTTPGP